MRAGFGAALAAVWALALAAAGPAEAQQSMTVLGNGEAKDCADAAKRASMTGVSEPIGLVACGEAIEYETLQIKDLAATFVNRGILYLCRADYEASIEDDNTALHLKPDLGEALVNRGAAKIAETRFAEGIADIDQGLAFNPKEPEKAYFNRALALERMGDLKGAYLDFLKASELKPDWDRPRVELARFTVKRVGGGT